MRIQPQTRALSALLLAGLLVAGCGSNGSDDTSAPVDPGGPAMTGGPQMQMNPLPSSTSSPTPTKTSKPKPTATTGSGDSDGDGAPATAGGGICSDLEESAVAGVLGGSVTGDAIAGGGCEFDQANADAPAATFIETSFAKSPGGMDGAKSNATSSVEGDPVDVSGIGEAAFVVTGTSFGGDDVQGAGAVKVGDRLVSVSLAQSKGLAKAKVKALVIGLLRLAAQQMS